jgi:NADH-quinone oxidoreductase subunit L
MMTLTAWLICIAIGLPWLGALAVLVVGDRQPRWQHALAAGFAVATGIGTLPLLGLTSTEVALRLPVGGMFGDFTFVADGMGVFLAAVATVVGSLAVVFSIDYMHGEAGLGRYYALVLFFIGGMAGLALTGSLLLLFFFWELVALCSYALISFYNDDPKAVVGGIKALIITQLGGVGLLVGVLVAWVNLGTYDISALLNKAGTLPPTALAIIGFGFIIAAAAKSAQVPFHTWLPGAMEAPTPVSALIHAATMVNAGVYLLARFYPAFAAVPGWATTVTLIGALSAFLAALMALVSGDLKRALAYSTISQLGYMVYAVGVGAVFASNFHLFSHAVFKALLFLGAGAVIHAVGTRDMFKMGALGRHMPLVRAVFVIGALALAGIPILNGFWSKELVLESGLAKGPLWAYVLMLAGAGLTALYTFRMVWLVFYGQSRSDTQPHPTGGAMGIALSLLAVGTLTTWLLVGPFGNMLAQTLPFHHMEAESTTAIVLEVITAPATWLALVVVALGLAAWWWRDKLTGLASALSGIGRAAAADFGFEWINRQVVGLTGQVASALRVTQTGQLNWNVVGIVGGLIMVLIVLVWGA